MPDKLKISMDGSIAATALASPIWMQYVQSIGVTVIVVIGVIGAVIRLAITWREYKKG